MKKSAITDDPVLLYQTEDGLIRVDVRMDGDTVWLSQEQIATLFGRERSVITKHIRNAFLEGELIEKSNVQNLHIAFSDKPVKFYSLDTIIAVGYRIKSQRGTQFRIWATERLKEYLTKGFTLDDKRLKEASYLDRYFDELTERIRDIRTSERQFYRKVADIYATSIDYDASNDLTKNFYVTVQNKFHFAITGQTAAEIIASRANVSQPNMGLTNWSGERILARDVTIAKNYLNPDELSTLNNVVEQYLVFAEGQAKSRKAMRMLDWIEKLHGFLTLNDKNILQGAGKLRKEMADEHAESEYQKYREARRLRDEAGSDFDALTVAFDCDMPLLSLINQQATRLEEAKVSFGHGTLNAFDEAVWLALWAMKLPIDDLDAVADAPVSAADQAAVDAIITQRIATRKPAAYLTNEAWLQGVPFYVDERVIVPRSLIAEVIADGQIDEWLSEQTTRVLDLCTGNGSLAVLAAMAYPEVSVVGSDLSADALAVARINVDKHNLDARIKLVQSDGLSGVQGAFDLILCNPPYVNADSMSKLPAEYLAEPNMALASGLDGMDFTRTMLREALSKLTPHGVLVLEIGNEQANFEAAFPELPVHWLETSAGDAQVLLVTAEMLKLVF